LLHLAAAAGTLFSLVSISVAGTVF